MRYHVGVLITPTSKEADLKHIVRGCSSVDEAIEAFMKSEDLFFAYAAYAYPVRRRSDGPSLDDWRQNICCSVSGKVSIGAGAPSERLQ